MNINIAHFVEISIAAILINNIILTKFLGLCPFFGVSKKLSSAIGMGMAVIFVMTVASMFTWIIYKFILLKYNVVYLYTIVFILVIASLVQLVEMILQKFSPTLYESLGIFLPLITTNCAILGIAVLNTVKMNYNFIESMINSIMSGVGFTLALVLMAGIREKLELAKIPKPLEGLPISFIAAGLMAIAFLGFSGLNFFQSVGG
jgi:electron transport complex protein RnfA